MHSIATLLALAGVDPVALAKAAVSGLARSTDPKAREALRPSARDADLANAVRVDGRRGGPFRAQGSGGAAVTLTVTSTSAGRCPVRPRNRSRPARSSTRVAVLTSG